MSGATAISPRCGASSQRCQPKRRAKHCPADDKRLLALWGPNLSAILLRDATTRIRFQLGQADRFREGLIRSSSWSAHIAETFANQGLPSELAVLPHVESSFNAAAYSKVGAAGLWQFMRSTGRRYMRVDDAVDERLDPYRSTEAAAQLLAYNYRVLGSWPLALTAYNHGAAGMRRAKESVGTDDYVKINRTYSSRTFGFASRNFFPSFLAALTVDENPEKYFGALDRRPEQKFREVSMPAYVRLATLERTLEVDREQLRALNPAWRPTIYNGTRLVPRGYRLRLPADMAEKWTPDLLAARLPANELYAGQITPRSHRVRKGETMAAIAQRYGMTAARLAEMNGLSANASLRAGRHLHFARAIATHAGRRRADCDRCCWPKTLRRRRRTPRRQARPSASSTSFVVAIHCEGIAARVSVPQAELLRMNSLRNPDFLYEGQRLRIAGEAVAVTRGGGRSQGGRHRCGARRSAARRGRGPGGARRNHASHRQRRADAWPSAFRCGGGRHGGRDHARGGDGSGAGGRECARTGVSEPGGRAEPGAGAGVRVAGTGRLHRLPGARRRFDPRRGHRDAGPVRRLAADPDAEAAQREQTQAASSPCCLARNSISTTHASRVRPSSSVRRDYHAKLQGEFFVQHRIAGTEVYIVRRGDSLWTMTQKFSNLPIWLLRQYNPDTDLSDLRAGHAGGDAARRGSGR